MTRTAILVLCLLYFNVHVSNAQNLCYSCTYAEGQSAQYECVTNPADFPAAIPIQCHDHCRTERTVSEADQVIYYFVRGCVTDQTDGCQSTGGHEKCTKTCEGELCNANSWELTTTVLPPSSSGSTGTTPKATTPAKTIPCYSCVYSYNPGADDSCVTDAASQRTIACPLNRRCYVTSQYDKSEGVMRSFSRGCESFPNRKDECTDSDHLRDCLATCCDAHCNHGDGTPSFPNGCPVDPPSNYASTIIVNYWLCLCSALPFLLQRII